jgi:hypothetical protein
MSEQKITIGLMGSLVKPIPDGHRNPLWDDIQDRLNKVDLEINYEGTLIYSLEIHKDAYDFDGLSIGNPANPDDFVRLCADQLMPVSPHTVEPYFAHWYNGADSPMSTLELEEFMKT